VQDRVPQAHQPLADEVRGEDTGDEDDHQRHHHAHAGHVRQQPAVLAYLLRQQQQRAIERIDDQRQHPDRDDEWNPDQQPGDQILLHRSANKKPGARRASGFSAKAMLALGRGGLALGLGLGIRLGLGLRIRLGLALRFAGALLSSPRSSASGLAPLPDLPGFVPEFLKSVAYQPLPFN
jgi:hypothetical protein